MSNLEKMTDECLSAAPVLVDDMTTLRDWWIERDADSHTLQHAVAALVSNVLMQRAREVYGAQFVREERFLNGVHLMGCRLACTMCVALDEEIEPYGRHIDELAHEIMKLGVRQVREYAEESAARTPATVGGG